MSRSHLLTAVSVTFAVLAVLAPASPSVAAAGKPAPVKITLKSNGTGRVVSDRAACVDQVDVFAFFRAGNGAIEGAGQTTTDDHGRYPTGGARSGRATKAFTFVLGNATCRVAQSDDVAIAMRVGQPAKRKVTLQVSQTTLSGRVTSPQAGCLKSVPVEIFAQLNPGEPWTDLGALVTDNKGRYSTADARRFDAARGGTVKVAAATFGTKTCRVAQSPVRTVTSS